MSWWFSYQSEQGAITANASPAAVLYYLGRMKHLDVRLAWPGEIYFLILLLNAIVIFYIVEIRSAALS